MPFANQKGNVIAYVIIAMTTIAALSVGALYMTSSAALGELGANNVNRAYFLALAGKDYALIKNLGDTATKYPSGRDFTFTSGDIVRLTISSNTIKSTGIVKVGTPFEARRQISITKTGFSSQPDISFAKDMQSFQAPVQSQTGFIVPGTDQISIGQSKTSSFGALWYRGGAVQGNCLNGKCDFGNGFRAFFVFQYASGSSGDGFTFAFFNGDGVDVNGVKNDFNSVGGDNGRGELLGYAGDSRVDSAGTSFLDGKGGRGIQPPKFAIEFDVYANYGSSNVCSSGSRRDGTDDRNHIAYVFWGDNNDFCTSTVGKNTYDDNRHNMGANNSTEPRNSMRPTDGADTSYFDGSSLWPLKSNWLLSNTPANIYAFRIEVRRNTTPNTSGNYEYLIESWVKQCSIDFNCSPYDDVSDFANTKINYRDVAPTDKPNLTRTLELSPATQYHQAFNTFYFGWTAATGGATQNVIIKRFRINFAKGLVSCASYGVWNNLGVNTYFSISGAGCRLVNNNNFIENIGTSDSIAGFTNAACAISSSPSSINYTQATTADTNKDCVVNFNGTDR